MKKRFLAFLLAVCVAVSMLVLPASAVGSNAAVQTATALGGLTAEQAGSLGAPLTRGQAARLLTAFSAYRDTTTAQGRTGRLYSDVDSDSPYAVYIRTAVQNGWMTGYSDGSFRPDNTVTLEEACTMALRLLGYDVAKLGGTFPTAQLSKASALGLRNEINARQGETLTLEQGTMLFYNALTAMNGSGQVYASTLGFAVSNGQVDISSVLLDNVKGPFVADVSTVLPFAPAAIYRNDEVTTSAALSPYDVYYYNESARTVWIYNKRAAGRVTAVSPSASAPTSVTVAGVTYTIDTLRDIRAQYPDAELFFITGADAVAEIMQWKDANKMWELAHFVAVTRPGYSSPDGVKLPEGKVDTLEIPALAISSTDVRRRAEHGEPVWYLVPDGVVQYIGKHGLYR